MSRSRSACFRRVIRWHIVAYVSPESIFLIVRATKSPQRPLQVGYFLSTRTGLLPWCPARLSVITPNFHLPNCWRVDVPTPFWYTSLIFLKNHFGSYQNLLWFEFETAESTQYVCEYQYGTSTTSRLRGSFPGYGTCPFLEPCKSSKE